MGKQFEAASNTPCVVEFFDVGRSKARWTAELDACDHASMVRTVRDHGALLSTDIQFTVDENDLDGGHVLAGFRIVGHWRLLSGRKPVVQDGGDLE